MKVSEVKGKAGRPTRLTPEMIDEAEKLAMLGMTVEWIADYWGVSHQAMYKWREKNEDLLQAIKKGKAAGVQFATGALVQAMKDKNITAIIFYLKNRAPDLWKDRREERIEHTIGAPTWTEEKTYIRTPEEEQVIIEAGKALELRKKKKEDSK
jgi:nitrogen regulatory protein PII-like uncharacterized protein